MKNLLAGLVLLFLCVRVDAATYYVRADGGSASQCTGLGNSPYSGSGTAQNCAWHHPFDALPPQSDTSNPPPLRLHGPSTLALDAPVRVRGDVSSQFLTALLLALPLVLTYLHTGLVPRFPTAILTVGLVILSALSLTCGLILDTVTRGRRELKLLAYLAQRAPAEERRRGP